MQIRWPHSRILVIAALVVTACGSNPTTPTPTSSNGSAASQIVINPPTAVSPVNGVTTAGWPAFVVTDSTHVGPASSPLVYRFDIATTSTFSTIVLTSVVSETPNQTSFTPPSTTPAPPQTALFWRAVAIDPVNIVGSQASSAQTFTWGPPLSAAAGLAQQEGLTLWPGVQPPGLNGHATMGDGWEVGQLVSFNGVTFLSPQLEQLQVFDLIDRGMDPQSAINWMHGNGYATVAAWYPGPSVIGFAYQYMALINGSWDMVLKAGA